MHSNFIRPNTVHYYKTITKINKLNEEALTFMVVTSVVTMLFKQVLKHIFKFILCMFMFICVCAKFDNIDLI